jgi:hypothetical protein
MRGTYWYALLLVLSGVAPRHPRSSFIGAPAQRNSALRGATRCTLVVEADSGGILPPLRVATALGRRQFVLPDSSRWTPPSVALRAQRRSSESTDPRRPLTVRQTSSRNASALPATQRGLPMYVLDLPAGGRGKFKAAALDSNDPNSESVAVTMKRPINGGILGAYPPAILRAGRTHPSTQLCVKAVGVGLAASPNIAIAAPDTSLAPSTHPDRAERQGLDCPWHRWRQICRRLCFESMGPQVQWESPRWMRTPFRRCRPYPSASRTMGRNFDMKEINLISLREHPAEGLRHRGLTRIFYVFYIRREYEPAGGNSTGANHRAHKRSSKPSRPSLLTARI